MALDHRHPIIEKEIAADRVVVSDPTACCEGNDAVGGHPAIYLHVPEKGAVVCPYCSRSFMRKTFTMKGGNRG
jgi:uncharacterized Zn-finger protein